ncbi:unnamed protein product [Ceutorhynchus assimilis]|uniref:27 kDa hemolymph protein n=1 Tax=Ceutorhynchus assimilis TaxID=467358 RepID=A0A9N9MEW5_9CUCU|nr:unnamed protein product [Ceutorhynchus assimilis]
MSNFLGLITVVLVLFGAVNAQISNSLDDPKKILEDPNVKDLEQKLKDNGISLPDFNQTSVETEKAEKVLREKCKKQNAEDAVDLLKEQQEALKQCVTLYVNGSDIQNELEEAKKTGSMDEVFKKYCGKWPDVYGCADNATATIRRCMTSQEDKAFNKTLAIVEELQEFMCFKDGDRLAMFVAEGGVECIQEQQEGIKECFNATVGSRMPQEDDFSLATLPTFLYTERDCADFDKIRTCVNEVLEKCHDTTPANIVDASLKFIKKQMACGTGEGIALKVESNVGAQKVNSAHTPYSSSIAVVFGIYLLLKLN